MKREEKYLYLECYSGISGDMTVGALLDLGASREALEASLSSLGVDGYHLHFGRTQKCGIDAYDFDVHLEEDEHGHEHNHSHEDEHEHDHNHAHEHDHEHGHDHGPEHKHDPEHEHDHEHDYDHGHAHDHNHAHAHEKACAHGDAALHSHAHPHVHRNIHDIFAIIDRLDSDDSVKELARRMFQIVAEAESKAHGIPIDEVHFHEVGAIDSIVDIISVAVCLNNLGITKVFVSSLAEGRGYVRCQHGVMPVPVPATANIASMYGLELKLTENDGEMVTPTGAAIAAALRTEEELPAHYTIDKIGVGAGRKEFKNANILRAMLITPKQKNVSGTAGQLWVLESNIDDCGGEALGFTMERLLEAGAKDVWYTPAFMKKNRPAYVLHVLCSEEGRGEMEQTIFAHTTTIGIRRYPVERTMMERTVRPAATRYGAADVKVCRIGGLTRCYPEYESIRAICREHGIGFQEAYQAVSEDAGKEIF